MTSSQNFKPAPAPTDARGGTCTPTATGTCADCGNPTWCGMAHGSGHDHDQASADCTRLARINAAYASEIPCEGCGQTTPGMCC